jgi:AraC family transcriptional regulator
MSALCSTVLFHGPLVTLTDVRCRARASGSGTQEFASSHHLVLTRTGVFVKHVGRHRVVAEPAHVLFFNKGEPFQVSHPTDSGDDCTVLAFAPDILAEVIGVQDPSVVERPHAPFTHSYGPVGSNVHLRYQELRSRIRQGTAEELAVEETTLGILHQLVTSSYAAPVALPSRGRPETRRARRELVANTRLALASEPWRTPSLTALSRSVHSSPYHLARVFRAEVGLPIHQYGLKLRLALSLERLIEDATGLSALALDLGFANHSHFTTLFRRTFGLSPSDFRRRATTVRLRELRKNLKVWPTRLH